ncbi:EFR1 family ferrodoxin [Fusibacter ferrireducens]|uniref:EFR1 family ferrodoxin n=1 Tax=Fusibacter ferrireducens TaxID=2785058 RepID=A0ABR9ZUE6_9FIRM|nr:EFR1 family ferrodoxin [Fusibacter ferrireducens]MBF4693199.1 EFR1 family ferrodoxin [Fusibacter ferrireducens]
MGKTLIYYFTGTGNSLHIADRLKVLIGDCELIPILSYDDTTIIHNDGATQIGFVFPIYMTTLPVPMRRFIKRLAISEQVYLFALATRIGTTHSAFNEINSILKRQNKKLDLQWSFNMPSNDPKFDFKSLTEDQMKALENKWELELESICLKILEQKPFLVKDSTANRKVPFVNVLRFMLSTMGSKPQKMYSDLNCIGCGKCERVCPSRRIEMIQGRPVWPEDKECYRCSACLNFCEMQASQISGMTENNGRYAHPFATIEQIISQRDPRNE